MPVRPAVPAPEDSWKRVSRQAKESGMTKRPFLSGPLLSIGLAGMLGWFVPAALGGDDRPFPAPTAAERIEYIRRARVWEPTDVASKDLFTGPAGAMKFAVDQEVPCDFVPRPLSGWTEKFLCRLEDGTVVKVKYLNGDHYKEVFGEVLGTRLFWALGFYCDRMLPVRVTCRGCPRSPWKFVNARAKPRLDPQGLIASFPPDADIGTYTFDPAAMEERLDGKVIEERKNQGWSWRSLDEIDPLLGGATRAEIDALKLLNAFVQNADNSAEQNTLLCPQQRLGKDGSGKGTCLGPVMYVDDLGAVFGRGGFTTGYSGRVDFEGWSERPVWRDKKRCVARLASIGGMFQRSTLRNPVISEEGRALLAKQLGQLSDAQITDLFRAARIERLHETVPDGSSGRREVTLQDWVDLFKKKRDEITKHPGCGAPS
jgi:hypothetical protein